VYQYNIKTLVRIPPIHVHVKKGDKETIYDLVIYNDVLTDIKTRKRRGKEMLSATDEKTQKSL